MERFSPIYADRKQFPAKYVKPEGSYSYVYPKKMDLEKVAYFFDYELENTLPDSAFDETGETVERWKAAWKEDRRPSLTYWQSPGFLQIEDRREPETPGTYTFESPLADIYVACSDRPRTVRSLQRHFESGWPDEELEAVLDEFEKVGLMMRDEKYYLSLALPATPGR